MTKTGVTGTDVAEFFDPKAAGWEPIVFPAFVGHVGPIWRKRTDDGPIFGLQIVEKHGNRQGVAHGGVLTTLLDTALGLTARGDDDTKHATITLDTQFITPARIGDFLVARCQVIKRTRSMIFVQGIVRAGDRVCAAAHGTWKILNAAAPKPA